MASRTSVFDRLGSPSTTTQRTVTQEPPFRAGSGRGARHRPYSDTRKKSGKASASSKTRQHWRVPGGGSPGRLCPALAESAGQLPGHRHCWAQGGHCIPATASAHPSMHQLPDQKQPAGPPASRRCLADEGSHRAGPQRDVPRILQPVVPGPQEDRRSATCNRPVHSQPPHGSSTLQDGDARVRPFSHQKSGVDGIDRHTRCLPYVLMHQAVRKYLRFVVNKKLNQFTGLPFGLATSPREFTKLLRPVVTLLRQQGVKLHVYLDDQVIRAHTPEQAKLHAQTTIRVLQFLSWIINYEKSDLTPSQDFQFIGMQCNTRQFTVAPLPKMRLKVQSVHQHRMTDPNITARDLHKLLGMLVFMASLVQRGRLRLRPVQWWAATSWCQRTWSWSDQIQVPQWVLSEVAWWASPAFLQGLPLATKETEVTLFTDASSLGWGAQLGSCSTRGQCLASQRSWHINALEMQAVINAVRDFLPHRRSRVIRLMCDNAMTVAYIKNEGGTRSHTLMQLTIRLLKWCDRRAITLVPVHLPGVHNIHADSLSRVGQTLTTEWTMAMERLRPVFAKFTNRRLIKFVSLYPDPGQSGQMPCPCLGTTGGASCTCSRHLRWSLKYCRSLSHQEWRWFWSLNCNRQRHGFRSWWICPKKIRSRCTSKVKTCWLKTFGQATGWPRLVTSGGQIHTPSWGWRAIPGKLPTWCQGAFGNLHSKCTNPIGQDSWRSVGRKHGMCFESEVIISAPTWCTSSETDFSHRRWYHIARLWLLCYVIRCTIRQPVPIEIPHEISCPYIERCVFYASYRSHLIVNIVKNSHKSLAWI